jgi:putative PIN family toxin of toxin-antitoxin system
MAKPAVVLDTNVVVSAHLSPRGLERYVLDLSLAGQIQLCLSLEILAEYARVLARPKFAIPSDLTAASLALIRRGSAMFDPGCG